MNITKYINQLAIQNYQIAEIGIEHAYQNQYQYWYIDTSLPEELPECWTLDRINKLKIKINKLQVSPIIHGNFKAPLCHEVDIIREAAICHVKKEIDLAETLNAPLIIHAGAIVEPRLVQTAKQYALTLFLKSLIELKNYAESKNVSIWLENLCNYKHYKPFHYIFTHEAEFDFIFNAIDLPFFLDIGHANIGQGNPIAYFQKYHQLIVGMSFSNNNGEKDQHFALNKGNINYELLLAEIKKFEWHGIIAFETRVKDLRSNIKDMNGVLDKVS